MHLLCMFWSFILISEQDTLDIMGSENGMRAHFTLGLDNLEVSLKSNVSSPLIWYFTPRVPGNMHSKWEDCIRYAFWEKPMFMMVRILAKCILEEGGFGIPARANLPFLRFVASTPVRKVYYHPRKQRIPGKDAF